MKTIFCTDSRTSIEMMMNADSCGSILVVACQDGEYWFSVGWFKTEAGAIRSARRQLAALNYTLNA